MTKKHLKTYEEWRASGRQVCKGARNLGKNGSGKALFALTQTRPASERYYGPSVDEDWDESFFWADVYGVDVMEGWGD